MAAVLLIRSMTDIAPAFRAVNEFLRARRSRHMGNEEDEILAVCLKGDLEANLPTAPPLDGADGPFPTVSRGAGLWIRESLSLSGIWAFCWVDGPRLRSACGPASRRDALLEMLAGAPFVLRPTMEPGMVFPVFGAYDAFESVEAELRALRARHPSLVGSRSYRDDDLHGLVSALWAPCAESPCYALAH